MARELEEKLECLPISELQRYDRSSISGDNVIFAVSEKNPDVDSEYISKNLAYEDLVDYIKQSLNISDISAQVKTALDDIDDWMSFKSRRLSTYGTLKVNIQNPYIISSLRLEQGIVVGLSGYYLSSFLKDVGGTVGLRDWTQPY